MAKLLLLETATEICSVGLAEDGKLLALHDATTPADHARQLTELIAAAMAQVGWTYADLAAVAVSSGPGSYTSLRVGVSTAKGLCYSLGLPLIALDTMLALAAASQQDTDDVNTLYAPMIDARRAEVYTAVFDRGLACVLPTHARVLDPDGLADYRKNTLVVVGDGAAKCLAYWPEGVVYRPEVQCSAAHLVRWAELGFERGQFVDLAYFEPLYLKPPFVTQPKKAV